MTINLLDDRLNAYAENMSSLENELLKEINDYTQANVALPIMLSGHLQGRVLSFLSRMIKPENILEIGTYTGYSALCLAEGLLPNGKIYTLDRNKSLEEKCKYFFDKSNYKNQIEYIVGDAKETLSTLKVAWDLVFIDADKKGYAQYFDMVIDNVKPGGYILADNVLYNGEVILPEGEREKNATAIDNFNHKISQDPRVEQVLLPIRDGILVIQKIKN